MIYEPLSDNQRDYWTEYDTDTTIYPSTQWYQLPYTCTICDKEVFVDIVHQNGKQYHDTCYNRMLAYQDRVQSRYERLANAAERASKEAEATYNRARDMASIIPFGQPIIGARDRSYREKIWRTQDRAVERYKRAERMTERAEAARKNRAISSDDPAAVVKYREQLVKLEKLQAYMVSINKDVRLVNKRDIPLEQKVMELAQQASIAPERARALLTPDFCGRLGFPDYALTNNSANVRRIKARIAELTNKRIVAETIGDTEIQHGDIRIVKNTTDNRLQILFPGKPAQNIIKELKSRGFHWSPSNKAWQRMLSNQAEWHAETIVKMVNGA